jgi:hypothetical protein
MDHPERQKQIPNPDKRQVDRLVNARTGRCKYALHHCRAIHIDIAAFSPMVAWTTTLVGAHGVPEPSSKRPATGSTSWLKKVKKPQELLEFMKGQLQ